MLFMKANQNVFWKGLYSETEPEDVFMHYSSSIWQVSMKDINIWNTVPLSFFIAWYRILPSIFEDNRKLLHLEGKKCSMESVQSF